VRRLAVVGAVVLAAGCSGHRHAGSNAAVVRIEGVRVGDAIPVEGSYSYVRVEQGGHKVVQVRLRGPNESATIRLDPGSYRLVSFQRTCGGNCNLLDAPGDFCHRDISLEPRDVVEATVTIDFSVGCRISF